uniref:Uncharacterized protein n=1 Tax=Rhizophora mucronata TaxID=61149 RepID=A0A2P2QWI9_RHIMU
MLGCHAVGGHKLVLAAKSDVPLVNKLHHRKLSLHDGLHSSVNIM